MPELIICFCFCVIGIFNYRHFLHKMLRVCACACAENDNKSNFLNWPFPACVETCAQERICLPLVFISSGLNRSTHCSFQWNGPIYFHLSLPVRTFPGVLHLSTMNFLPAMNEMNSRTFFETASKIEKEVSYSDWILCSLMYCRYSISRMFHPLFSLKLAILLDI